MANVKTVDAAFVGEHADIATLTTKYPPAQHPGASASVFGIPSVVSDGLAWRTQPYILTQSAVPSILPSSGTSNATGQITLTTALPYQPSGTVQVYLPAGVVTSGTQGSGAGLYYATFSSTTVCQLTGTVVTGNAAYTQTTAADLTLATITVPGGAMGANGSFRFATYFSVPNNANNKTIQHKLAGSVNVLGLVSTTTVGARGFVEVMNRGTQSSQIHSQISSSATATPTYSTIDTSINQSLTFTGQLAVATDYIILEGYTVEVLPG